MGADPGPLRVTGANHRRYICRIRSDPLITPRSVFLAANPPPWANFSIFSYLAQEMPVCGRCEPVRSKNIRVDGGCDDLVS